MVERIHRRLSSLKETTLKNEKLSSFRLNLKFKTVFLVCDDDPIVVKLNTHLLRQYFKKREMEVELHSFNNGLKCLVGASELYSSGCVIIGLMIDETMPFMRGSQTISALKTMAEGGHISGFPAVSVTAYFDDDNIDCIYSAGADRVLCKPLSGDKVKNVLDDLIRC